ncbi:MAG: hypothetical protein U9Q06_02035 [Nanoarchaeota archaeon]|nr:hypothetical protein [Nanoarchaeota archaeon]
MKLKELQAGQGSVNIQLTIKSVEEPRIINKYGKDLKLANAIATDGESEIKLTLWNEDVDKVKTGAIIKIENGYVSEFQGEKQLTSGKFGKLEVVDGTQESEDTIEDSKEEVKEEVKEESPEDETSVKEEKIEVSEEIPDY